MCGGVVVFNINVTLRHNITCLVVGEAYQSDKNLNFLFSYFFKRDE